MENRTDICTDLLNDFLDRWPVSEVKRMTLDEYVSVGNPDTFGQWLETKTKIIGNIKGISSFIFGIYKRQDTTRLPKTLYNDNSYSWRKIYGKHRNEAFNKIKKEILDVIHFAGTGQFEKIDEIRAHQFFKWKLACLYSNERLIPIFKREVLLKIANHFHFKADEHSPISELQRVMISNKPANLSIYDYQEDLYYRFGDRKEKISLRRTTRRATSDKNTGIQKRRGAKNYIAKQVHNELQKALRKKLIAKYGARNVSMEEDYVDIKVTRPHKISIYEVKSSSYAGDCVREALGQMLAYSHRVNGNMRRELIVVGQNKPNSDEVEYIDYVKRNLKLNLDYYDIDNVH